jgi:uncharacterized protein
MLWCALVAPPLTVSPHPYAARWRRPLGNMTSALHDLLIRVTDLVDRPGTSRRIDLRLPVPEDVDQSLAQVDEPVRLTGVLESVVDGILVRGSLEADLTVDCARCLKPTTAGLVAEVVELFSPREAVVDLDEEPDAGYEIDDGHLNLDTLVRDTLIPAIPYRPLCRPDCRGLCATCGTDRNESDCSCEELTVDARWSALAALELPDDDAR